MLILKTLDQFGLERATEILNDALARYNAR